jgi:hypothetical protein
MKLILNNNTYYNASNLIEVTSCEPMRNELFRFYIKIKGSNGVDSICVLKRTLLEIKQAHNDLISFLTNDNEKILKISSF